MRRRAYMILVPSGEETSDLVALACQRFGGLTRHAAAYGYWRAPDGRLIEEEVTPWEIAVTCSETAVLGFASLIAERLDQQCVYVRRPDGSVVLVDQEGREVV